MYSPKAKRPKYLPRQKQKLKPNGRFHGTSVWKRMSSYVRRTEPVCKVCEHLGQYKPADATDHVIRISDGGSTLDQRNLMPICTQHHEAKNKMELYGYQPDTINTFNGLIPYDLDKVVEDVANGLVPKDEGEGVGGLNLWI